MSSNTKSSVLTHIGQQDQFTEISMQDVIQANKEVHINLQVAAPFVDAVEVARGVISMARTEEVDLGLDLRKNQARQQAQREEAAFEQVFDARMPTNILNLPDY